MEGTRTKDDVADVARRTQDEIIVPARYLPSLLCYLIMVGSAIKWYGHINALA